jgi:hypothetical protein
LIFLLTIFEISPIYCHDLGIIDLAFLLLIDSLILMDSITIPMSIIMSAATVAMYMPTIVGELKKQNERLSIIAQHLDDIKRSSN